MDTRLNSFTVIALDHITIKTSLKRKQQTAGHVIHLERKQPFLLRQQPCWPLSRTQSSSCNHTCSVCMPIGPIVASRNYTALSVSPSVVITAEYSSLSTTILVDVQQSMQQYRLPHYYYPCEIEKLVVCSLLTSLFE